MIQKDTPPSSPDMNNLIEDEDMVYVGDVEEVIDTYDVGEIEDEDAMEEDPSEGGISVCVFRGHKRGKCYFTFCDNVSILNDRHFTVKFQVPSSVVL